MESIVKPQSNIATALCKAQLKFKSPQKTKTVTVRPRDGKPPYTFQYADYHDIIEVVRPALNEHQICVSHVIFAQDGHLFLKTTLLHASGESIDSFYPLPGASNPKELGGAITYGKRYCLSAITGVAADDDLDAEPDGTIAFGDNPAKPRQAPIVHPPGGAQPENSGKKVSVGPYVVPFGKHKGKSLAAMGVSEVRNYAQWIEDNAAAEGKQPQGLGLEFIEQALKYLKMVSPGPAADDIPLFPSGQEDPSGDGFRY